MQSSISLEPIGRHLTIIPIVSVEEAHEIVLAKHVNMPCGGCKGKGIAWSKWGHAVECARCGGAGSIQDEVPITRINYWADVVAVGADAGRSVRPGDVVAVSYWAGRTAAGSRILDDSRYGLPAGSLVCSLDEIVAVRHN